MGALCSLAGKVSVSRHAAGKCANLRRRPRLRSVRHAGRGEQGPHSPLDVVRHSRLSSQAVQGRRRKVHRLGRSDFRARRPGEGSPSFNSRGQSGQDPGDHPTSFEEASRGAAAATRLRGLAIIHIAGLVPHLRPFLASLWAVLSGTSANDGAGKAQHSGKLVHLRRIRPALKWIEALVKGEPAPLHRTLESHIPEARAEVVTDASPWGIGGVLKIEGRNAKYFSSEIPQERFKAQTGLSKYNTLWEGLALLVAFRLWLPELGRCAAVRAKSDNLGVLCMLAKGGAKSKELNALAREFALDQALRTYRLHWLEHIPGVTNLEADALSRQTAPVPPEFPESLQRAERSVVNVLRSFWKVELD